MQMSKKAPRTKSFESLQASMKDELLVAKVESFISIAKLVQTFLVKYQQEAPLLPFMAHDLLLMIQSLMQRFVTIEALSYCKSAAGLLSFDFSEKNLNAPQNVDIGFKAKKALSDIAKNVSAKDILQFRIECREFLRAVVQKLLEKSPIKCKLVRNLKWMQPKAIVEDLNGCLKQLEITLSCLVAINRVNSDDCDTIKSQFLQWHTSVVSENSYVFQSFDSRHLDTLFKEHLGNSTTYAELWKVTKSSLFLSHGQAQVERGFSVNKETMTINMLERTLIAKRAICDHLSSVEGLRPPWSLAECSWLQHMLDQNTELIWRRWQKRSGDRS